jgi:MFS family permease
MAGTVGPEAAPRRRYIPRGHSLSWWMLVVTTGAILVTSVDRAILFRVLPALQEEFGLSNTAAGFLGSLNSLGVVIGAIVLGVFGDALGKGVNRAWTWAVAVSVTIVASIATAFVQTLGGLQFWRVIMGAGTGGMEPVNVAMIGEW